MAYDLPTQDTKAAYVEAMFDRIADRYDVVNDAFTGGLHRLWKRRLVGLMALPKGGSALDLATGTGDIARLLAAEVGPEGRVEALDFSAGMLGVARERGQVAGGAPIHYLQGDMLALPFPDASFDAVTVGFGLRNVADLDLALREIARVLKPGGRGASLDTGTPPLAPVRWGVGLFNHTVIPTMGKLLGHGDEAYSYLPASADHFPAQVALAKRFDAAGLEGARAIDLMLGAAAIVLGRKLSDA